MSKCTGHIVSVLATDDEIDQAIESTVKFRQEDPQTFLLDKSGVLVLPAEMEEVK